MSLSPRPPVSADAVRASMANGTLSKSVFALAIEPLTMALTVTGRKAYDVMLWLAQRQQPNAEGGYTSPVSAIVKGYGSTTKASERVQRYIEQMVQTTVVWRPLALSEQGNLLEAVDGPGGHAAPAPLTDEARTFPLLAEARLYVARGEAWVTWYYPPSIKEQLVNPERWAQIELNSIARLSTYTAVALYEICARYKDSPGGLTSRHEPGFWTRVLREGGGIKPREFRKFKSELLVPAMAEINALTEIAVEVVEHRQQGALQAVQFRVARRARTQPQVPTPADVTQVMRAAKLGIREADLDALQLRHGAERLVQGLDAMEQHLEDPRAGRIHNPLAYLRTVLANRESESPESAPAATAAAPHGGAHAAPTGASGSAQPGAVAHGGVPGGAGQGPSPGGRAPGPAQAGARRAVPGPVQAALRAAAPDARPHPGAPVLVEEPAPAGLADREELLARWRSQRHKQLRLEFAALAEAEQGRWIDLAAPQILGGTLATPGLRKRLAAREWESPLISRVVLEVYANSRYGPQWKDPSDMDLVMFAVSEGRKAPR